MAKLLLIVEDEETAARALERKFTGAGFVTTVVKDGIAAMEQVKKSHFDVILLDILLPRKDGFEVLADLKASNNQTPVVVLTNLGAEVDKERVYSLGAKGYFIKSMTPMKDVLAFIKTLLPSS